MSHPIIFYTHQTLAVLFPCTPIKTLCLDSQGVGSHDQGCGDRPQLVGAFGGGGPTGPGGEHEVQDEGGGDPAHWGSHAEAGGKDQ